MRGATLNGRRHAFADLREVMAKATPHRSGDVLAGVAPGFSGVDLKDDPAPPEKPSALSEGHRE